MFQGLHNNCQDSQSAEGEEAGLGVLTEQRHAGIGCPQPVDGHTCVVAIAILCHVDKCEYRSGAEVLDINPLAPVQPGGNIKNNEFPH